MVRDFEIMEKIVIHMLYVEKITKMFLVQIIRAKLDKK
jgi:hypothetical protein